MTGVKFTIITVCLNAEKLIERTIKSVLSQTYNNIEFIVIDGGSVDSTCDIIAEYQSGINNYARQDGEGIYNAMNQGVGLATGNYIHFLNAGDTFYTNKTITEISKEITSSGLLDIVYGDFIKKSGSKEEIVRNPDELTLESLRNGMVCHQALFANKELFANNGLFDERYSIVADYEWLVRNVATNQLKSMHIKQPVVHWDTGGISSTSDYRLQQYRAMRKYYGLLPSIETVFYPNVARNIRSFLGR